MSSSRPWKSAPQLLGLAATVVKRDGLRTFVLKTLTYIAVRLLPLPRDPAELGWAALNNLAGIKKQLWRGDMASIHGPRISILVPVYNTPPRFLKACVDSVLLQTYADWELCLHDDASTHPNTLQVLSRLQKADLRIKLSRSSANQNISLATNAALEMASGEYVTFLDHDDALDPDALSQVAAAIAGNPQAEWIYSDEDKIEPSGLRHTPFFKPDWNPDLLRSFNYVTHLAVYKRELLERIGCMRPGFEGAQDYDLALRAAEAVPAQRIVHIPKILYHWRRIPASTAADTRAKPYADAAGKRALREHLERTGVKAKVLSGIIPTFYRVKRQVQGEPSVAIIIPFRDRLDLLDRCVSSIRQRSTYRSYRLLLVDNKSSDPAVLRYLASTEQMPDTRVIPYPHEFNYSALNNYAVSQTDCDYILLLNNDTEVIARDWLQLLLEHAQRPEVGAVGARLLFPDRSVQHAGVVLLATGPGHSFKGSLDYDHGYFGLSSVIRDCSAVTGACLMTRRELYEEAGGLDEVNLPIAYNDVDYCLRLREKGYLIVYTPYAKLFHHESVTRGYDDKLARKSASEAQRVKSERDYMARRWSAWMTRDPYYNPNLTQTREDYRLGVNLRG